MSITKERVFGLDVMRAIAIILVVASHCAIIFSEYNNILTDSLQLAGVLGVEIFFVLSGFLIGIILFDLLTNNQFTTKCIKYFWVRRWFRTLPLYFLILFLAIGKEFFVSGSIPSSAWKYFLFLQNFNSPQLSFFSVSWSLTIEEYSYLLAPVILLLFSYVFKNKKHTFLYSTLLIILMFILNKCYYSFNVFLDNEGLADWNSNLKGVLIYRLDSIFYGFLMVYIFKVFPSFFRSRRYFFLIVGALVFIIICSIMLLSKFKVQGFELFWNIIYLPLNSIAIACTLPFFYYLNCSIKRLKKIVEKVSLYSYAIYLTHYTLILSLILLFVPIHNYPFFQKVFFIIIYLLLCYFFSAIVYRFFEKPMMDLRDKPIFKNKKISNS